MNRRVAKVSESLREVLASLILGELKDPRLGFVTITAVRSTPDIRHVDVYFTVLDPDTAEETLQTLQHAAGFLRGEATRQLGLKFAPELHFKLDDSGETGRRVDELLIESERRREESHPDFETALGAAARELELASDVAIACHVNPDGDAFGSLLALRAGLLQLGKRVIAGWGEDGVSVGPAYDFLPGAEEVAGAEEFNDHLHVAVSLDCASVDRLGLLADAFTSAPVLINIDHHVSNPEFGTVDVVDPTASSTAEIVYLLLERMGVEITPEIATCLYTGLVTDTGRFAYASVTDRTHNVAGKLVSLGIGHDTIGQKIWESQPWGYLKVLGEVLTRAQLVSGVAVSWIEAADLEKYGVEYGQTDEVIDVLRSTSEADVTLLLKEQPNGTWKGSLRSKGLHDVSKIASGFGGGGHRLAAGFSGPADRDAIVAQVVARLRP